jgi:hypothetical protein
MDIDTIIYLLFLIISIVFSAAQSNKKKKKRQENQQSQEQQNAIEQQWQEFIGMKNEQPTPQTEETIEYESYDEEYISEEYPEKPEIKEEPDPSYYSYEVINQQKEIAEKLRKAEERKNKSQKEKDKLLKKYEFEKKHPKPKFDFDPVKAVIYSEILKRPEY